MLRAQFLQIAAAAATSVSLPLHVTEGGDRYTLTATFHSPPGDGPFPLIVLGHGAPRNYADVATQFARFSAQSRWFVGRGCAVIVPNRRGYGGSTGPFAEGTGPCSHPDFARAAAAGAQDIVATVQAMRARPDIDETRIVLAGVSAGGYGSLAAGARNPPGVVGVMNFDGGRGSLSSGHNCDASQLVRVAGTFGRTARAPSVWMYARNDGYFSPALGRRMFDAYAAGHRDRDDRFVELPAWDGEGHYVFDTAAALSLWTPYAADFLERVL